MKYLKLDFLLRIFRVNWVYFCLWYIKSMIFCVLIFFESLSSPLQQCAFKMGWFKAHTPTKVLYKVLKKIKRGYLWFSNLLFSISINQCTFMKKKKCLYLHFFYIKFITIFIGFENLNYLEYWKWTFSYLL